MKTKAISIDPETMSGAPVFRGTRVTIQTLFDYLEDGYDVDGFLKIFDWVKKEDVLEVLELAKKSLNSKENINSLYENFA